MKFMAFFLMSCKCSFLFQERLLLCTLPKKKSAVKKRPVSMAEPKAEKIKILVKYLSHFTIKKRWNNGRYKIWSKPDFFFLPSSLIKVRSASTVFLKEGIMIRLLVIIMSVCIFILESVNLVGIDLRVNSHFYI